MRRTWDVWECEGWLLCHVEVGGFYGSDRGGCRSMCSCDFPIFHSFVSNAQQSGACSRVFIHTSLTKEYLIFIWQHLSDAMNNTGEEKLHWSPTIVQCWLFTSEWLLQLLHFNKGHTFKLQAYELATLLSSPNHKAHADILYWTGLSGKAAYVCVPKTNRMQVSALLSSVTREHESGSKEHVFSVLLMPALWADSVWVWVGISKCSLG